MSLTEEAIKTLIEIVKDAREFVLDQAPAIAVEMVRYGRLGLIIWIVSLVIGIIVCRILILKAKERGFESVWCPIAAIMTIIWGLVQVVSFFGEKLLMPWVAPKLYILTELTNMLKNR